VIVTEAVWIEGIMIVSMCFTGLPVPAIEAVGCDNPAPSFAVLEKGIDIGRGEGSTVPFPVIIIGKGEPVIFGKATHGGKPHKAIRILGHMEDMILRQAVIITQVFKQWGRLLARHVLGQQDQLTYDTADGQEESQCI
jgi:hypothetical protein